MKRKMDAKRSVPRRPAANKKEQYNFTLVAKDLMDRQKRIDADCKYVEQKIADRAEEIVGFISDHFGLKLRDIDCYIDFSIISISEVFTEKHPVELEFYSDFDSSIGSTVYSDWSDLLSYLHSLPLRYIDMSNEKILEDINKKFPNIKEIIQSSNELESTRNEILSRLSKKERKIIGVK